MLAQAIRKMLKPSAESNPFKAGSGSAPPHLAGRERELAVGEKCLRNLSLGNEPDGPLVLMAPRGQGKTVLLNHLGKLAEGMGLRVVRMSPVPGMDASGLPALLEHLLTDGSVAVSEGTSNEGGIDAKVAKATHGAQKVSDLSPMLTATTLRKFASKKGLALILDEAHELQPNVCAALLRGEQDARGAGAKVQLMLAGTPDLKDHFSQMHATFWDRLGKRLLHLNLLDRDDSAAAITEPMKKCMDEGAKDAVFELTSGYPYFLQIMGESLWDLDDNSETITADAVKVAEGAFVKGKNAYYLRRHEELQKAGMLGPAFAVATLSRVSKGAIGSVRRLERAVASGAALGLDDVSVVGCGKSAPEGLRFLLHKGFAWQPSPHRMEWTPGIPTLMDFVREAELRENPDAERRLMRDARFRKLLEGHSHTP